MNLYRKMFVLLLFIFFSAKAFSWEKEEHQILADLAFDSTLNFCGINSNDSLIFIPGEAPIDKILWNRMSFGDISSFFSGDDISQSHCHLRGQTIMQQLDLLSESYINAEWEGINKTPGDIQSIGASNQNAVFNFLLYHIIAARFARLAGEEAGAKNEKLRWALTYEAAAQSYLSDAFSSGHMLLSVSDFLAPLNYFNVQITHDYYCSEGVYVINSQGDCWQAFGDKLLQWYPYPFSRVFEACTTSLRELFLVYFTSQNNVDIPADLEKWTNTIAPGTTPEELSNLWVKPYDGVKYYSEIKMPSLLYIPMPVAAAWSVLTDMKDKYGIYIRRNYPQLIENNFHDPDLYEIDTGFLYPKNSMPAWMIPKFLPNDSIQNLIRYHSDIASVRYVQDRYIHPSYMGYLLSVGGSYIFTNPKNKFGVSIGFGWGFSDEFLFILNKPSVFVSAMRLFGNNNEWLLMTDAGFDFNTPIFSFFLPHLEFGYAWGFQSTLNENGGKYALGFDTETIPLGFTYAGLTVRLKYQFIFLNKTLRSPMLEVILH
ncbi:MAG: hypothetical protein ACM339_05280 [Ignavibacteria bacterium]